MGRKITLDTDIIYEYGVDAAFVYSILDAAHCEDITNGNTLDGYSLIDMEILFDRLRFMQIPSILFIIDAFVATEVIYIKSVYEHGEAIEYFKI